MEEVYAHTGGDCMHSDFLTWLHSGGQNIADHRYVLNRPTAVSHFLDNQLQLVYMTHLP